MSYDSEQLRIGTKTEMEHTSDPREAERIAKDHLRENPRYYPTGKRPKGKKEALRYESIFQEADELLPNAPGQQTLVIHMKDPSTDFLTAIYEGKGYQVITGRVSEGELYQEIKRYPRIFMLGHGSPSGLFGPGYLIGDGFGRELRKKTGLYIWCHAVEYAHKHRLSGLVSGMFISEVGEARYMGITATQQAIDASNNAFSQAVRRYIDTGSSPHEVRNCYSNAACLVTQYNNERLYVMQNGVILDALGQPQPEETSAKVGSPRYRDPRWDEPVEPDPDIYEPPDEFRQQYGWKDEDEPELPLEGE